MSICKLVVWEDLCQCDKGAIKLPETTPPAEEWDDDEGPGPIRTEPTVEVLSQTEQRYRESNEQEPPEAVVTSAPVTKESLVAPVEVDAGVLWGFLEALECITVERSDYPILAGVKIQFIPGESPRLLIEANNRKIWAGASLKAWGGGEGFEAILPLQRTISILKRLVVKYSTISIGMDRERVHIGNFSFPFFGRVGHFPRKQRLEDHIVSVTWSTSYADEILERLLPAIASDDVTQAWDLSGIFIDLEKCAAIATNGHRMHVLDLPLMKVEHSKRWKEPPKGVRLPLDVYRFVRAVENRDWTGFRLGENKIMIGSEDFGLVCDRQKGGFPNWSKLAVELPGRWTIDREMLLSAVKEASLVLSKERPVMSLVFDQPGGVVTVVSSSGEGQFEKSIEARPSGRLLAFVTVSINSIFLLDAIDACRGGSVRVGVGRGGDRITFRGDDNCFFATVMPTRR